MKFKFKCIWNDCLGVPLVVKFVEGKIYSWLSLSPRNNHTYNAKLWCICSMKTPKHWRCQWQICENLCNNNGIWKRMQQSIIFSNYRLGFWVYVDLLHLDWNFVFTWKYERIFLWDWAICFSIRVCTNSHTLQQIVDNDHRRVEKNLKHNNKIS